MTEPPRTLDGALHVLRAAGLLIESRGTGGVGVWGETSVSGVSSDSRTIRPGEIFLAWQGGAVDAHSFVAEAEAAGAVAAVVERVVPSGGLAQWVVRDGRRAAALVADWFHGSPWRTLRMVGITGTNGKTTTALLTRHLLATRWKSAALGTLGVVGTDGRTARGEGSLTTPGPVEVAATLRGLLDEGVEAVAMEASSHALDQARLDALRFDVVVFTNLTRDHLDYHDTLEAYGAAKLHLLALQKEGGSAIYNGDDSWWSQAPELRSPGLRVTAEGDATGPWLAATGLKLHAGGSRFTLWHQGRQAQVELSLPGRFNVENALTAGGAALALGLSLEEVARGLSRAPQVPGRMELVATHPVPVLVDYAHTPDALERVLTTLRPLVSGRLIVVFGAGGDRDRTKRPEMGRVAARWADLAVVTSDNPRGEDPERILDDIVQGMSERSPWRVADRREAIRRALATAGPHDAVLVAGKGHERHQIVGDTRFPFDDRDVVRELLAEAGRVG